MTRLIDADKLKVQIPTIEDEYKYVHKLIDSAPAVPQVTVFAETADEQAIADLKAELQSVLDAGPLERIGTICDENCGYNPQGDLISRKFVNELVCAEFVDLQDGTEEWRSYVNDTCESILEKIDNAPTVEPICNQIAWEQGYEAGLAQGKSERPQGEWKYTTHYARRYRVCPICTAEKEDDRSAGWNFCWHCGADMRKGGAE